MDNELLIKLKLPFDYEINEDVLFEYENENPRSPHKVYKPLPTKNDNTYTKVKEWLHPMGIQVLELSRLYSRPNCGGVMPHSDFAMFRDLDGKLLVPNNPSQAIFNIYFGAKNCVTRFWDIKEERMSEIDMERLPDNGVKYSKETYKRFDYTGRIWDGDEHDELVIIDTKKDCTMIGEYKTHGPYLMDNGYFHSTYNPDPIGRWCISFTIVKPSGEPINMEEAKKILKNYIDF